MEEQFFKEADVVEACYTFLEEFCDPYISESDMVILAMYRASKEVEKLRANKHKENTISSIVHEFENQINESAMEELKRKNIELITTLKKLKRNIENIGAGEN